MRPPLSVANTAREQANRERAEWLVALANEETTVVDVVEWAATEDGRALLRIPVRKLLLAQPGWGEDRTRAVIQKTIAVAGGPAISTRKVTIAWLLDLRAAGKRFQAFCDALAPNTGAPWTGFPFAQAPASHLLGGAR